MELTGRDTNLVVARLFEEIAQSLEVAGDQGHRLRAYRRASRAVAAAPGRLEDLAAEGRLREIPGIGQAMSALISEFLETGAIRTHQRLVAENPPGLAPLLHARGFGPAGVQALHTATGAANLDDVEEAARDGRLAQVLGPRRAEELLGQLPALRNPVRSLRLKSAFETAHVLVDLLSEAHPRRIAVAGSSRRMCEMASDGLDLVAVPDRAASELLDLFTRLPSVVQVTRRESMAATVRLYDGLEVRLHLAEPATWGTTLLWHTGSQSHLARLEAIAHQRGLRLAADGLCRGDSRMHIDGEATVYEGLGLPYVAPELREDTGEIEAAIDGSLPHLIEEADLKGDLHCHTTASDGTASIEEMAVAAKDAGYEYLAITDHSASFGFGDEVSPDRLREQIAHIRATHIDGLTLLAGSEVNILPDGSLD